MRKVYIPTYRGDSTYNLEALNAWGEVIFLFDNEDEARSPIIPLKKLISDKLKNLEKDDALVLTGTLYHTAVMCMIAGMMIDTKLQFLVYYKPANEVSSEAGGYHLKFIERTSVI